MIVFFSSSHFFLALSALIERILIPWDACECLQCKQLTMKCDFLVSSHFICTIPQMVRPYRWSQWQYACDRCVSQRKYLLGFATQTYSVARACVCTLLFPHSFPIIFLLARSLCLLVWCLNLSAYRSNNAQNIKIARMQIKCLEYGIEPVINLRRKLFIS